MSGHLERYTHEKILFLAVGKKHEHYKTEEEILGILRNWFKNARDRGPKSRRSHAE